MRVIDVTTAVGPRFMDAQLMGKPGSRWGDVSGDGNIPKCFLKKDQKTKRGQDKRDERLRHFRKRKQQVQSFRYPAECIWGGNS